MVKIINGEIVQDNDPRLNNHRNGSSNGGSNSSSSSSSNRRRNFHDLNSLRAAHQQQSPQTPNNPQFAQRSPSQQQQRSPGAAPSSPLDGIAQTLGIHDKFITIPAIPPLGFSETRIGFVNLILLGIMYMLFGNRALLFALIMYGMYKHQER